MLTRTTRCSLLALALAFVLSTEAPAREANNSLPTIVDWNSLEITLERGASYRVSVRGDGTVIYKGNATPSSLLYAFVAVKGEHEARVSRETVRRLFELVQQTDLSDTRASLIGNALATIAIAFDGFSKAVQPHHLGFRELADEIDRVAERWTIGNEDTVPSLKRERWNFRSQSEDNLWIVPGVARYADVSVLKDVLAQGVPIGSSGLYGCLAIRLAAENPRGGRETVAELLRRGAALQWKADAPRDDGWNECDSVEHAASLGSLDVVELLLRAKGNQKCVDDYRMVRRLIDTAAPVRGGPNPPIARVRCPEAARLLMWAGADANDATETGHTPLILILARRLDQSAPEVMRTLLKVGADANARTRNGETALMQGYVTPEIARILVAAGADVNAVNSRGQTALSNSKSLALTRALLALGADPRIPSGTLHRDLEASCVPVQRAAIARETRTRLRDQDERCKVLTEWIAQHAN